MSPLPKSSFVERRTLAVVALCACVVTLPLWVAGPAAAETKTSAATAAQAFDSPQAAVEALLTAMEKSDDAAMSAIFGPDGEDIIHTGEPARDKKIATDFLARAHEKKEITIDPKTPGRAVLVVGQDDWPLPVPIAKHGTNKWVFDSKAGLQEILYRRIGGNELDAIQLCRGYVEAQDDFAVRKRADNGVAEYAQRIISTPGKQDGLAWKNADGTWEGPIGERIAEVVEQGYAKKDPFHGYFFKVLKGQGAAAPLGQLDYVVKGVMIGGFALAAAPAEYRVTGVKTFIVSNDGVVYEKDLGPNTLEAFHGMELFNPDSTWHPVESPADDEPDGADS